MADDRSYTRIKEDHEKGHPNFVTYKMITIEDEDSLFYILICNQCPYIKETYCGHKKNKWNDDETQLTCTTCGIDGT